MGFLEPRLSLKVQQKQILTPGLVQMVSLLTLNKLELIDQIQQELVQNPVLEEGTEIVEGTQESAEHDIDLEAEAAKAADALQISELPGSAESESSEMDDGDAQYSVVSEREVVVEHTADTVPVEAELRDDPYDDIDFRSFDDYLNDSSSRPRETENFEKPSFENFLAKPPSLTDHLSWLLGLAAVEPEVRSACHSIIGNLNEDGYLLAADENGKEVSITLEEIAESGGHTLEDVEKALAVVQRFDPPGVGPAVAALRLAGNDRRIQNARNRPVVRRGREVGIPGARYVVSECEVDRVLRTCPVVTVPGVVCKGYRRERRDHQRGKNDCEVTPTQTLQHLSSFLWAIREVGREKVDTDSDASTGRARWGERCS